METKILFKDNEDTYSMRKFDDYTDITVDNEFDWACVAEIKNDKIKYLVKLPKEIKTKIELYLN